VGTGILVGASVICGAVVGGGAWVAGVPQAANTTATMSNIDKIQDCFLIFLSFCEW
jgi:hypothetical protein